MGMGGRYRKGSAFERQVVAAFMERGWVAFRAAGSGKADKYLPDVVALKSDRFILIECKVSGRDSISLKPAITALAGYMRTAGGLAYIAVRFFRKQARYYDMRDLVQKENYTIHETDEYLTLEQITWEKSC
jgi:Holliday junction resolvase